MRTTGAPGSTVPSTLTARSPMSEMPCMSTATPSGTMMTTSPITAIALITSSSPSNSTPCRSITASPITAMARVESSGRHLPRTSELPITATAEPPLRAGFAVPRCAVRDGRSRWAGRSATASWRSPRVCAASTRRIRSPNSSSDNTSSATARRNRPSAASRSSDVIRNCAWVLADGAGLAGGEPAGGGALSGGGVIAPAAAASVASAVLRPVSRSGPGAAAAAPLLMVRS